MTLFTCGHHSLTIVIEVPLQRGQTKYELGCSGLQRLKDKYLYDVGSMQLYKEIYGFVETIVVYSRFKPCSIYGGRQDIYLGTGYSTLVKVAVVVGCSGDTISKIQLVQGALGCTSCNAVIFMRARASQVNKRLGIIGGGIKISNLVMVRTKVL